MTTLQRMQSDIATIDKRDMADKLVRDSRVRNDELTIERRYYADMLESADKDVIDHRIKNDESTNEKRFKADKIIEDHRLRNDEMTANRRESKDATWSVVPVVNNPFFN